MTTSTDRVAAHALSHGLSVDIKEFPQGTRTASDAAAAIGCAVAQIVKSLVFIADDQPLLVLTSGANRVDETHLARTLKVTALRMASADEVRKHTGYAIGGTPPFAHATEIRVVCDRDLTAHDVVWAAAGTPQHVFAITPQDLLRLTDARVVTI